ncbi:hypothetical protein Tco_1364788, partial [Tanacetum coccineum]
SACYLASVPERSTTGVVNGSISEGGLNPSKSLSRCGSGLVYEPGYEIIVNDLSYVNICPCDETIGYELLNGTHLLSEGIILVEDMNNKCKQNPPSYRKGSFQDMYPIQIRFLTILANSAFTALGEEETHKCL